MARYVLDGDAAGALGHCLDPCWASSADDPICTPSAAAFRNRFRQPLVVDGPREEHRTDHRRENGHRSLRLTRITNFFLDCTRNLPPIEFKRNLKKEIRDDPQNLSASILAALFLATPAIAEEGRRQPARGTPRHGRLLCPGRRRPPGGHRHLRAKIGGDPQRVVMGLAEGDSVAFSMPGNRGALYAFSRSGEEVTVSSETDVHLRAEANALTRPADGSLRAAGRELASVGPM